MMLKVNKISLKTPMLLQENIYTGKRDGTASAVINQLWLG